MYDGVRRVEDPVSEILSEYELKFDLPEIEAIVQQVDVAETIAENQERRDGDDDYEDHRGTGSANLSGAPVDDLFEVDGPMHGESIK